MVSGVGIDGFITVGKTVGVNIVLASMIARQLILNRGVGVFKRCHNWNHVMQPGFFDNLAFGWMVNFIKTEKLGVKKSEGGAAIGGNPIFIGLSKIDVGAALGQNHVVVSYFQGNVIIQKLIDIGAGIIAVIALEQTQKLTALVK